MFWFLTPTLLARFEVDALSTNEKILHMLMPSCGYFYFSIFVQFVDITDTFFLLYKIKCCFRLVKKSLTCLFSSTLFHAQNVNHRNKLAVPDKNQVCSQQKLRILLNINRKIPGFCLGQPK
jgi:hypothetical protein